ncbi:MAG: zinc-ribbon domain-containing protein [Desulfamplus sp.]|nr:zinc-ribbon domain-containing protein [Desulfamplus sp.]MBF0257964.1 zinc-ribbon domain-containing protein [Desulfamplus sp.]
MEIACTHCTTKFNIPDEKIPKGRKFSLKCPKCRQHIHIIPVDEGIQSVEPTPSAITPARQDQELPVYNAADRPFGGILDKDAKTAMLCIAYPHANELAVKIMNSMQYHIMNVDDVQTALKSMTYHLFDIIILDEDFDINRRGYRNIMEYLNELDMMSRRKIVVLLISKSMHTMDNMAAFNASVNQIINYKQVNSMESLLQRTIIEHDQFYSVYNETLRKLGKMT